MARQGFSFGEDLGYVVRERNGRFRVYHEWQDAGGAKHQTMLTRGYRTKEAAERAIAIYRTNSERITAKPQACRGA